jgi:hypothetical protein
MSNQDFNVICEKLRADACDVFSRSAFIFEFLLVWRGMFSQSRSPACSFLNVRNRDIASVTVQNLGARDTSSGPEIG